MYEQFTIRLSEEMARKLRQEAMYLGVSIAEAVRLHLEVATSSSDPPENQEGLAMEQKLYALHRENNLLLRKLARYTNIQLVREVDAQLPLLLEKET